MYNCLGFKASGGNNKNTNEKTEDIKNTET